MAASGPQARPRRVIVIVLDSVGIGELPDAAAYGDEGSNTLGNIAAAVPCLSSLLPGFHLDRLHRRGVALELVRTGRVAIQLEEVGNDVAVLLRF